MFGPSSRADAFKVILFLLLSLSISRELLEGLRFFVRFITYIYSWDVGTHGGQAPRMSGTCVAQKTVAEAMNVSSKHSLNFCKKHIPRSFNVIRDQIVCDRNIFQNIYKSDASQWNWKYDELSPLRLSQNYIYSIILSNKMPTAIHVAQCAPRRWTDPFKSYLYRYRCSNITLKDIWKVKIPK